MKINKKDYIEEVMVGKVKPGLTTKYCFHTIDTDSFGRKVVPHIGVAIEQEENKINLEDRQVEGLYQEIKKRSKPNSELDVSLNWEDMDTSGATKISDEHLLILMKDIKCGPGWGLVAELCKRYQKEVVGQFEF